MNGYVSDEEDQYVRDVQAATMAIQELHRHTKTLQSTMASGSSGEIDTLRQKGQKRVREIKRRIHGLRTTTRHEKQTAQVEKLASLFEKQQQDFDLVSEQHAVDAFSSRMDDAEAAIDALAQLIAGQHAVSGNEIDSKEDGQGFVSSVHGGSCSPTATPCGSTPIRRPSTVKKRALEVDVMRHQVFYRRRTGIFERTNATTLVVVGSAAFLLISYVVAQAAFV